MTRSFETDERIVLEDGCTVEVSDGIVIIINNDIVAASLSIKDLRKICGAIGVKLTVQRKRVRRPDPRQIDLEDYIASVS